MNQHEFSAAINLCRKAGVDESILKEMKRSHACYLEKCTTYFDDKNRALAVAYELQQRVDELEKALENVERKKPVSI